MKFKAKKFKLVNSIGSILQITKNMIQQNENYHDYLINKNNNLYLKQLPLLVHSKRINSSFDLLKDKLKKISSAKESKNNCSTMDEEDEKQNIKKNSSLPSLFDLYQIRNISIKSKKLPPLCPLFNQQGELVHSMIASSKIRNKIVFEDENQIYNNNISFSSSRNKNILSQNYRKFGLSSLRRLIKIDKGMEYRSNNDINLGIDYGKYEFENFFASDEEYKNLKYDESEIFGRKNRKHHENIIRQKIIELQFTQNTNLTEKKEKIFEYANKKKEVILTLDSLVITIKEIIDEENFVLKDEPSFIYELPLALLPLFYFKGAEKFLMILSKIIKYNTIEGKFELIKDDDKMISHILKQCDDFELNRNSNIDETNEADEASLSFANKKQRRTGKGSLHIKSPKKKGIYAEMFGRKSNGNFSISSNIIDNSDFDQFHADIYSQKKKSHNYLSYNSFEYYWITNNKSFLVILNTPLITLNVPYNNIIAKKYIEFDLLFYLYEKQFLCWDFYVIKYLYSFKSFRNLLKKLNAIPEIKNRNIFIIQPKKRFYNFNENKFISILSTKQKNILNNNLQNILTKTNNISNNNNSNDSTHNNPNSDNEKVILINSVMIQKSLEAVVSYVNENKGYTNEYVFHFSFEQMGKFQILENYIDMISLLIKFLNINYENESVSFDYDSFNTFNVINWILEIKKYNNKCLRKISSLPNLNADNNQKQKKLNKFYAEYEGAVHGVILKIEIKDPIVVFRSITDIGEANTKCIKIDIKAEKMFKNNNAMVLKLSKIVRERYENKKYEEAQISIAKKNKKFKKQITMVNIKDNEFLFDKLISGKKPSLFEFIKNE